MKKIILLLFFMFSLFVTKGQGLIDNNSFENTSCDICATLYEFYEGCETDWQNYKYAPAAFDSSIPNCTFYNGGYYYAPHGDKHALVGPNSGFFQVGDFQPGTYTISFNYTRGEGIFENYPVYVNVGFANGLVNVDWDETTNDTVPIENVASQLVQTNDPVNWATYNGSFTLTSSFEDVVIYGSSSMQFHGSGDQTRAPSMRALVDNFVLECIDCECIPDPVVITAEDENSVINDITNTLTYTIPCGENCVNIHVTSIENAVYNTSDLVLTDLNGLFCLPSGSDLQSFTAVITGQDTCGDSYYQEIAVNIEQDCDTPEGCEDFNSTTGNWETSAAGISISSIGPTADGTPYMRGTDGASSTGSWIFNETDYIGNLGDDGGTCFCWDYKVFDDSVNGSSPAMNPRIRIYSGTATAQTSWATFVATSISITENDDWVRVCAAPILEADTTFPSNADGAWVMASGSTIADWNALIANIDGITFHTDVAGSSTQNEVIGIDNFCVEVCCDDEPYIEPFWEQCESNNVCELESWPIHVLDDDGTPLLIIDGYSFLWSDGSTSDSLYGVVAWQEYWVEVTYPDGCVYTITYYKECCEDDITVIFDECPKAEMLPILERELQNYDEGRAVVSRPDLERAIEFYRELGRADGEDCDPCIGGIVNITIVDSDGNPITNYDSITITNNDTGVTVPVGIPNFGVYVDTPYTVTVVVTDAEGHECIYTYDFEYVCEGKPCSELMSPTNVQLVGDTLTWDPVPDAVGYIVESTNFWPIGCSCENPVSIAPIQTTETFADLPVSSGRCFVIQVRARCADGTLSNPSDWICVGGHGGHGGKTIEMASIIPNPTNGRMTFNVETTYDTQVTIEVYNFYGNVIKSFVSQVSSEREYSVSWDGSDLTKGVYFVKFKTNQETIHKRVIVH